MIKNSILTKKAHEVIEKKLKGKKLTQQDSNYLSRFIRPKLREMASIDSISLLKNLEYNPKAKSVERKIKEAILATIPHVASIIVCGSAIQTNYRNYRDIDVIIATKEIIKDRKEKRELINKVESIGKEKGLNLEIQIYTKKSIISQYPSNPSLIYQLKDSKVIYGTLNLPNKTQLSRLDLKMKLDWSEIVNFKSEADEIYHAIRNAMLVLLLMNKKVDNNQLNKNLENAFGSGLLNKLKNNHASKTEKKLAFSYLTLLTRYLEEELRNPKWEKIELESP